MDHDCNGFEDQDNDGDGYLGAAQCGGDDCDDTRDDTFPGATLSCDGVDQDCDGLVDGPMHLPPVQWISNSGGTSSRPAMVWTDSMWEVFWEDSLDTDWEIYQRTMLPSGSAIGAASRRTDDDGSRSRYPDAVWTGSEAALVWTDSRNGGDQIFYSLFRPGTGTIQDQVQITADLESGDRPAVAWTGYEIGLGWRSAVTFSQVAVYLMVLSLR